MTNAQKTAIVSRSRTKPTAEQIASLREERERKRQLKAQEEQAKLQLYGNPLLVAAEDPRGALAERIWVDLAPMMQGAGTTQRIRIKTWNLLAQCLVRRKLFPESDCLKSHEREHMLYRELLHPRADIICLQETDRLDKILPFLEAAGYKAVYASGPRKKHGCLIAFSAELLESTGETVVNLDGADRGASFRTKNIASLVGLRSRQHPRKGFVVATTHLFWHPSYTYERTRQAGILLREATKFRDTFDPSWPCILAGDFNFAPDDVAYALLVGEPLLPQHKSMLARSRVIHTSIDPSVPVTTRKLIGSRDEEPTNATRTTGATGHGSSTIPHLANGPSAAEDDDDEEGGTDPDKAITNARGARPEDGLFSTDDLSQLFAQAGAPVISLYDEAQRLTKAQNICGTRLELPQDRRGYHEPEWTSYTHYWKTVLDYIYVTASKDNPPVLMGYLQPPTTEQLQPGIPRKGVTSSDHVSLTVDVAWK